MRILFFMIALLAASPAFAEVIEIDVQDMVFRPERVTARPGDTLEWHNKDSLLYTATAQNGDWNVMIPADGVAQVVVRKPGLVDYYCKYHVGMKGQVNVLP